MKNILNIFKTDIRNIRSKRAAIVVIVALMILPSMYAWFNILPSWDPYANTSGVNIAVVNLDEGGEAEGKEFNVGDEVVLSLMDNKKLGWQFVGEEEAMKGVEHGDYYASIIIPKDFSSKLASVLDEEPEKPVLDYYINEKINAIAPKVTNAGASGIVESIQTGFVKVTNEAIFTVFNDIGIELETNRGEIERFRDTVYKLEKELPEIERMLGVADTDLVAVEKAMVRVNEGMVKAEELSKKAEKASTRIEEMLREGDQSVQKYVPLVKQDLRLAQTVIQQIPAAVDRAHKKGDDLDQFLTKLEDGTGRIDNGTEALQNLADLLEEANQRLTQERKLEEINASLQEEMDRLNDFQEKINEAIHTLEAGEHLGMDIVTGLNQQAIDAEKRLQALIEAYEGTLIPEIEQQIDALRNQHKEIQSKILEGQQKNQKHLDQVNKWIEESPVSVEEQLEAVQKMQDEVEQQIKSAHELISMLEMANKIQPNPEYDLAINGLKNTIESLETVQQQLAVAEESLVNGEDLTEGFWPSLKESLEKIDAQYEHLLGQQQALTDAFNETIQSLEEKNQALRKNLASLQETVENIQDFTEQLVETVENPEQLLKTLKDTSAKVEKAKGSIQSLMDFNTSLQKLFDDGFILEGKSKVENLQDELQQFKQSILRITNDAKNSKASIAASLDEFKQLSVDVDKEITALINYIDNDLMPKYEEASRKANDAIKEGNKLLAKASMTFPKLYEMLEQADDGVAKGKEGLAKANEVFPEAKEKVLDIASKIRNLEEQGDLDKIINLMKNDPSTESDFLSDPLFLEEHELFPVPNYGSAMAPFFTAMSLWVGGLILVSSLIVDVPNKHRYKSYEAYFGRFITFWLIGMMQALIVTMGNMFLLKTFVAHKLMYVLFAFIISTTFVVIIYTFVSVFGNTGKVIAIIMLVMQLGASGGTFPIQMTPEFFQRIHAFLPFTHALGLFREAVGGIIWPVALKHIAWLAGYVALFLFIGIRLKEKINKRSDKFLEEARESKVIL